MARKEEIESKFENLTNLFNSIEPKPSQYAVFIDFLNIFIRNYSSNYNIDFRQTQLRYNQKDWYAFGKMFIECLEIVKREGTGNKCFDLFGTFVHSHKTLSSYFARNFTQSSKIYIQTAFGMDYDTAKTVYDPYCQTARRSLEINSKKTGMFHTLIDHDYSCVKISALNLMLHGIDGVVICDNALNPKSSFKGAFIVNRFLHIKKYPRIVFVEDVKAAYQYVDARVIEKRAQAKLEEQKEKQNNNRKSTEKNGKNQKGM